MNVWLVLVRYEHDSMHDTVLAFSTKEKAEGWVEHKEWIQDFECHEHPATFKIVAAQIDSELGYD